MRPKWGLKMNSVPSAEMVGSLPARPDAAAVMKPVTIKVSIVEDDAKLRETLVRYFTGQSGFRCVKAYPNAEDALADIPKNLPDVVLMDINLPGMSGIECVSAPAAGRCRH